MTWWLRVHRTTPLVGLTVALATIAICIGPIGMLFPSFGGAPLAMIPVAAVVPLVIAIATSASVSRAPFPDPARRTDLLELGTVLMTIALVSSIGAAGVALGADAAVSIATIRNTIAFSALALVSRAVLGDRYQSVPGVLYLFVAALFGRGSPGNPAAWAGVVTTSTDPSYWGFVVPIVGAAIAVMLRRTTRRVVAWGNQKPSPDAPGVGPH